MSIAEDRPKRLLEILWHSLGMKPVNYRNAIHWWLDDDNHRNQYCAAMGDTETVADLELLAEQGLMFRGLYLNGGLYRYYHVSDNGVRAAREAFFELRKPGQRAGRRP